MPVNESKLDVELIFNDIDNQLSAQLKLSTIAFSPSLSAFKERLNKQGFGKFYLYESTIDDLLRCILRLNRCSKIEDSDIEKPFIVAEKKDALIEITSDDTGMSAYIDTKPAYGGSALNSKSIELALRKAGIRFGIDSSVVKDIAARQLVVNKRLIACGKNFSTGEDTNFVKLIPDIRELKPQIDDDGNINYRELGDFKILDKGTHLLKKIPASAGRNGFTVLGDVVPGQPGTSIEFVIAEGSMISPTDPNLLIASTRGHPIFVPNGVRIDPTLSLRNVNLSTGNIRYDGSVHVKADVADNMEIEVTGNLVIDGVVGKAAIKAGGSVIIKQGLIGGSSDPDDNSAICKAKIIAEDAVSARYIDNAEIYAGGVISAREYINHSEINSDDRVLVGHEGGRGVLLGGHCSARERIEAKIFGSSAAVATYLEVGIEPELRRNHLSLTLKRTTLEESLIELNKNILTLGNQIKKFGITDTKKAKLVGFSQDRIKIEEELAQLLSQLEAVENEITVNNSAKIKAQSKVHEGVVVMVLHERREVKKETSGGSFVLKNEKIAFV